MTYQYFTSNSETPSMLWRVSQFNVERFGVARVWTDSLIQSGDFNQTALYREVSEAEAKELFPFAFGQ